MSKLADRLNAAVAPKNLKAPKAPLPPKAPKPGAPKAPVAKPAKPAAKPAKPAKETKPAKVKPAAKPAKKPAAKPAKAEKVAKTPKAAKVKHVSSRRDNVVGEGKYICTLIVHLPGQGSKSRTIRGVAGKNFEAAMQAAPKHFHSVLKDA